LDVQRKSSESLKREGRREDEEIVSEERSKILERGEEVARGRRGGHS
jgi:hypothetical protein